MKKTLSQIKHNILKIDELKNSCERRYNENTNSNRSSFCGSVITIIILSRSKIEVKYVMCFCGHKFQNMVTSFSTRDDGGSYGVFPPNKSKESLSSLIIKVIVMAPNRSEPIWKPKQFKSLKIIHMLEM